MASLVYSPTLSAFVCSPTPLVPTLRTLFGGAPFALQILPQAESSFMARARSLFAMSSSISYAGSLIIATRVLGGVLSIVQGLTAVPIDGSKIASGAATLATSAADLVSLVAFPVALARTALAMRAELVAALEALKADIIKLQNRYTNVNQMIADATASGNAAWLANATCAKERLDAKVAQYNASLSSLALALQLLSTILCIVTGGHIPVLPTLSSSNLVTDAIDVAIAALNAISIPDVPGPSVSC
jgi:hypothetical protein